MTASVRVRRGGRTAATSVDAIYEAARRLLVAEPLGGLALRAVARAVGLSATALYRYVPNVEALRAGLCVRMHAECRAAVERAAAAADPDPGARLVTMCRAFRAWSLGHPAEFRLLFSTGDGVLLWHALDLSDVLTELSRGATPGGAHVPPPSGAATVLPGIPPDVVWPFWSCWLRVYSFVALEAQCQLPLGAADATAAFEAELAAAVAQIGVTAAA